MNILPGRYFLSASGAAPLTGNNYEDTHEGEHWRLQATDLHPHTHNVSYYTHSLSTHFDRELFVLLTARPDVVDLRGEGGDSAEGALDGYLLTVAPGGVHVAPPHVDHCEYTLHAEWVAAREYTPLREEG